MGVYPVFIICIVEVVVEPSKFKYTYYSVRCAHYEEPRARSKGLCPNQRSFALGCEAKITLVYSKA